MMVLDKLSKGFILKDFGCPLPESALCLDAVAKEMTTEGAQATKRSEQC